MSEASGTVASPTTETNTGDPKQTPPTSEGTKPVEGAAPAEGESKPVEGAKPNGGEPAPLTAETIKLPEGFKPNEALMGEFLGVMNDQSLDRATLAQRLVDLQTKAITEASERNSQAWLELRDKWAEQVKADPVIGGEKLEPSLGAISKLLTKFSTDAQGRHDPEFEVMLKESFESTGIGDNPWAIRFLYNIAKELALEGRATPANTPPTGAQSAADLIYNKTQ